MRHAILAFWLASGILFADSIWTKEPADFKGVPFNASESQARQTIHFEFCHDIPEGKRVCVYRIEVTEHYAIVCYFVFSHDRLETISGQFPSQYYEDVRKLFVDKYGDPMTNRQSTVQAHAGGTYEQEELLWQGQKVSLLLSRFGANVEHGSMTFLPTTTLVEQQKHEKEQKANALK